jgi:PEP-CTERM motif
MKISISSGLLCLGFSLIGIGSSQAALLSVLSGTNNVPITRVIYGIPGSPDVVQTASVGVTDFGGGYNNHGVTGPLTDTPVNINSMRVNSGGLLVDLNFVNSVGATVVKVNPELASISGLGVFNHNSTTVASNGPGGLSAFSIALASTFSNSNLRNFSYYDFLSTSPTFGVPDYDVLYTAPMMPGDYLLIAGMDGLPIPSTNDLLFGGLPTDAPNGQAYSTYQWNSGYAAAGNFPTQAQAFTALSALKFFEGTGITPVPIKGFRIDNDGEADVKIMIMSETSFENRVIPEPSTFLMGLGAGLMFVFSRTRKQKGGEAPQFHTKPSLRACFQ